VFPQREELFKEEQEGYEQEMGYQGDPVVGEGKEETVIGRECLQDQEEALMTVK